MEKGGKTESLLAFAEKGVRYIGDEWILQLSGDGSKMHGIPGVIPCAGLAFQVSSATPSPGRGAKPTAIRTVRGLDKLQRALPKGKLGNLLPIRFLRDALPPLKKRLNVAFDAEAIFSSPLGSLSARPDKFILAMSHFDHDIGVDQPIPCMSRAA